MEQAVPVNQELQFEYAKINGEPYTDFPQDLYIPPDALQVFLETFEGPLDLLLYLIRRQNIDILNIPIADITHQYVEYIELMREIHIDLAAEYLVMAAMLAEIKSRLLLPRTKENDEEDDPRADLIRRLQEYERYKKAAEDLDALPRRERDTFEASLPKPDWEFERAEPDVELKELLLAFGEVLKRAKLKASHRIEAESLSIRERMSRILEGLNGDRFVSFGSFFDLSEGRMGVVVTFMAILELFKDKLIEVVQAEAYAPIHLRALS